MQGYVVTRYGMEVDLSREGKTACPKCRVKGGDRSGDNLHVYGLDNDGGHRGAFCHSCEYTIPSTEWLKENGVELEEEYLEVMGSVFNDEVHDKLKAATGVDSRNYRGIETNTSRPAGVRYTYNQETGEVVNTYYPCTQNGKPVGYKVRQHPKDFANPGPIGETGKDCELFGQFRFKTLTNTVVLVGGEHDQLAAYQMLSKANKSEKFDPPAVVSSTVGEAGAYRQVQGQYEFFNQFKKIIVCMDSDEAGRKAMEKVVEVLPRGKVFILKMRYKDPNEYLLKGKESEFISDFWSAKPYTPPGVKSASDGMDEIEYELSRPRITLPKYMHRMQEMMGGGIIQGRMVNIIAYTSVGKSAHVNRMMYHWIYNSPVKPTVVSLEATAGQYSLEMLSIHLQNNLLWNKGEIGLAEYLKTEEGIRAKRELSYDEFGQSRYFIVDEREGGIEEIEAQIELLWKKHGSKLFIIDVLSDLLRGSSAEKAEDHLKWQRQMAKNGVTMINVLHTRKPANSGAEYSKVSEYDALGTGSFVQSAAINIVLNRDKLSEDSIVKNTTEVDLAKCRNGQTGAAGKWYYEFDKATCHDLEDYLDANPSKITEAVLKAP